jgi:DNA-binding NarL/FixJ family response regulator
MLEIMINLWLSPREREVLKMVAEGLSTKEVASELGLSHKTIECYRQSLMKKLGVHDVVRLTHCAIKLGAIKV